MSATLNKMKEYFSNEFVSISYNEELSLGRATWTGNPGGADYRESLLLCMEVIDRFTLSCWLGDNRKLKEINKEDMLWTLQVFGAQLAESSLRRMANLLAENTAANQNVNDIIAQGSAIYIHHVVFREFVHEQEAVDWLLSPNEYQPEAPKLSSFSMDAFR